VTAPRFGVGYRAQHAEEILAAPRAVDWLEVLSENQLDAGGARRARLLRLREQHPVALHGVGLSIAGSEPLDAGYLRALRALADELEPVAVSDHLSWTGLGGHQSHDLLPVACTREVLEHVAARVHAAQEALGRRLLLENATAYVAFRGAELDDLELLAELCRRTGCGVLLDVNNLYVNAKNLGCDPGRALAALAPEQVGYMHLAGHAVLPDVRIDTHDAEVPSPVWELFERAARRFPAADVVIERDERLPPFAELCREVAVARERHASVLESGQRAVGPAPPRRIPPGDSGAAKPWAETQRAFFARLVDKQAGHDHSADAGLRELLDDTRPVSAARGMRVYSDAYAANLRAALATQFPALAAALRGDDFEALAAAYLRRHPPHGHGFVSLGAELAGFVREHRFAADYGAARAALSDLAALEQAQLEAQEAPDAGGVLAPEALAAIAPEVWAGARFTLAPALRLVRCAHDVLPAVEATARGEAPASPTPGRVAYLVYRVASGGGVRTERLDWDEADALDLLRRGAPFADACAAVTGADEAHRIERAMRLLVRLCASGLIQALR
jgi:hypothetical protein